MSSKHTDPADVRVVILAGGKGTRLKPYSTVFPKPLMPIGDMPILEVILRQLRHHGFKKVTIAVNHLANLIMAFFGKGEKLGLEITYCEEDQPLGTAGCLSIVDGLTAPFLVMNGDLLTTIDPFALLRHHVSSQADATLGAFPRQVTVDFGVVEATAGGELLAYTEKPKLEYLVSMGVNVFDRSVLQFIPKAERLDIPELMMNLVRHGKRVCVFRSDCEWLDIGRPDDYERAVALFHKHSDIYAHE